VVAAAAAAGVRLLALTDHDTVDGVEEASRSAAPTGMALVSGVEISALDSGQGDLHVLGYLIDHRDPRLRDRLHGYRADRERRADAMAQAIRELGFELDEAALRERVAQGKSIGRPHLAAAVVSQPANAQRLADEACLEPSAFLVAYLIEGRPAFRQRSAPTVADAIEAIHDAGGVAIWAHPFWDVSEPQAVLDTIDRFRSLGLDGVECFYATHTREQTELLADRCAALGLLSTGSSDFHGPEHRQFSTFRAFSTYGREPALGRIGNPQD
jgi:predicted metal-dependent phosphoesterase TrpH